MATSVDTARFSDLKARVEALAHQLFVDDSDDGDPRYYIHDPKIGKHVIVGVPADEIEHWCVDMETEDKDRQIVRGRVPVGGTTDGENGLYHEPTQRERREAIQRIGDAAAATEEAQGAFYALHGMGRLLQQDTLRDDDAWMLSIAHMIVEESDRMIEFLDRPGGWSTAKQ